MVTASTAMSTLSLHDALPISYVLANVYRRAAIGEALALAIVPWLLAAVLSTLRRPSALGTLGVAFATAALLASHLLTARSEEHTSELQSQSNLVCRLLLEKKN